MTSILNSSLKLNLGLKQRPIRPVQVGQVKRSIKQSLQKKALSYEDQTALNTRDQNTASSATAQDIQQKLAIFRGKTTDYDSKDLYFAIGYCVQQYLFQKFLETQEYWQKQGTKRVYYFCAEFLVGRMLANTLINLDIEETYIQALKDYGNQLEDVVTQERDASLGNGGLGRLAACFVESLASTDLPGWGYGIRYEYGMFKQKIQNNRQIELSDEWSTEGYPFEMRRPHIKYPIKFGGTALVEGQKAPAPTPVQQTQEKKPEEQKGKVAGAVGAVKDTVTGAAGAVKEKVTRKINRPRNKKGTWEPTEVYWAQAYDNPQAGYKTENVGNIRLWDCQPLKPLDLTQFNVGAYADSTEQFRQARMICSVLYPNDATEEGKFLRLKQQYFFCSASLIDALETYKQDFGNNWDNLPEQVQFHLNDTHPAVATAELMRLLIDENNVPFEKAYDLTQRTFQFTNHTVMLEALEQWPVQFFDRLLPRHLQIIEDINDHFLAYAKGEFGKRGLTGKELDDKVERMAIIHPHKYDKNLTVVNMGFLSVVMSEHTNGVAAIHSGIIKKETFGDFSELYPTKFNNKTNGVTFRRWIRACNPELAALITQTLGSDDWLKHAEKLKGLESKQNEEAYQKKWWELKQLRKNKVFDYIEEKTGTKVANRNALLDIQIKRIHEYKRQHLNIFSNIYKYEQLKKMTPEERKKVQPRVVVIGGKAASSYDIAKRIIALANDFGERINNDPDTKDILQVFFLEDYNVSLAEKLIPGAELSQHISTAGTEGSGTSNMKFQVNGSLIIGTWDGANIEIAENVGPENVFVFGIRAEELNRLREERKDLKTDPRFNSVCESILAGNYGDKAYYKKLVDQIYNMKVGNDWFLLANDFADYLDKQKIVDQVYADKKEWIRRSIVYTANSGFFNSDRVILEYANELWRVKPCKVPYKGK